MLSDSGRPGLGVAIFGWRLGLVVWDACLRSKFSSCEQPADASHTKVFDGCP